MIIKGKCAIFSNSSIFSDHSMDCNYGSIKDLQNVVTIILVKGILIGQVTSFNKSFCVVCVKRSCH